MKLRDRIGVSASAQRRLTRLMQLSLIGMLFIGIERGSTGIIVNTGIGLLVAQLPAVLERDYEIPLDAGLTLWITGAVWLHALGTVGLPGAEANFYATIWWWDHLTHALSSSIVAAAGYTTVRSLDQHSDGIHIPPRFMFVFILLFVLAFGVLWEVIEFGVSTAAASVGSAPVLTQYGLGDTMLDLVFDTIGAVVVAVWGTAYLTDVVGILSETLDTRST
ncbi:hypothetical protein ACAH01_07855 [Halomicrobium sp. HM KBTZ05]|uniref:hypothetical protein n=1 Tax=Halomicrobium sp. HM KBTZ05 TaxID=3242663 RepID=UPI0035563402